MKAISRIVLSAIWLFVAGWINTILNNVGTLVSGNAAVRQLDPSDTSFLVNTPITQFGGHISLGVITLIVLALIWFGPIKRFFAAFAVLALLSVALAPNYAEAYYDKSDYTEAIYVLPNQSAFVIPDVGNNVDSQAQFMSQAYLDAKKVPAKRVVIPHAKLSNSGGMLAADYYVPSARVILVTREPFNKVWVSSADRGTSAKNEGMPCQSTEGLNITAGISIGVSVSEEGAAKYLYNFGTKAPVGSITDPQVIFTSVYYARSVAEVMDTVGHGAVLGLVCDEISKRTLDQANNESGKIIAAVRVAAQKYLADRGITLDYLGWADTFSFDHDVQKAINDKYMAVTVLPVLSTLQAVADIRIKEGLGDGLRTKGLPQSLIALPTNMLDLTKLFGATK